MPIGWFLYKKDLQLLSATLTNINETLLFIRTEQDKFIGKLDTISDRASNTEKEVTSLKEEIKDLREELSTTQREQKYLYDQLHKKFLVISGVPVSEKEEIFKLYFDITAIL